VYDRYFCISVYESYAYYFYICCYFELLTSIAGTTNPLLLLKAFTITHKIHLAMKYSSNNMVFKNFLTAFI